LLDLDLFDTILLATGRTPNVTTLGLEAANVDFSAKDGIYVNEFCQTTNPDVYSVGDCLAKALSKEMAEEMPGTGP
jgi:glutathione reductase (NADPH)